MTKCCHSCVNTATAAICETLRAGLDGDGLSVQRSVELAGVGIVCAELRPPGTKHLTTVATFYGQSPGAREKLVCALDADGYSSVEKATALPSARDHDLAESLLQINLWVTYCGRAVPLLWRVLEHTSATVSTDPYLLMLRLAHRLLQPYADVMILAYRGFANHDLLAWSSQSRWHYCLRLPSDVVLHSVQGQKL